MIAREQGNSTLFQHRNNIKNKGITIDWEGVVCEGLDLMTMRISLTSCVCHKKIQ